MTAFPAAGGSEITMMTVVARLFLWFLFYSFLGWVYESILVSVQERRWVNRGFLNGPVCPIYGVGAVLAELLLSPLAAHPLAVFLISAAGASVLEYVTSWAMERMFHARWWDYSDFPFNLNGRICLLGAVAFGLGGVVIVLFIQPHVERWTALLPIPAAHILSAALAALFVVDLAVTVAGIVDLDDNLAAFTELLQGYASKAGDGWQWGREALAEKRREWTESSQEIRYRLRDAALHMLSGQQQRMLDAFPHLKSMNHDHVLKTIRELIRRR